MTYCPATMVQCKVRSSTIRYLKKWSTDPDGQHTPRSWTGFCCRHMTMQQQHIHSTPVASNKQHSHSICCCCCCVLSAKNDGQNGCSAQLLPSPLQLLLLLLLVAVCQVSPPAAIAGYFWRCCDCVCLPNESLDNTAVLKQHVTNAKGLLHSITQKVPGKACK
mgnify:CR=1 FL=1